jgi:hypothetical protein
VSVLAAALPRDSALARGVLGERADWTRDTGLLADLVDVSNSHLWAFVQANRDPEKPGPDIPAPVPVHRPGEEERPLPRERPVGHNQARARAEAAERERQWRESRGERV